MEKSYTLLTASYRFLLALLPVWAIWNSGVDGVLIQNLVTTSIIIGYVLVFSIFKPSKILSYIEWIAAFVMVIFFKDIPMINLLLLIPFLQMISLKASILDLVFFGFSMAVFEYVAGVGLVNSAIYGLTVFTAGFILNINFKKIGILESWLQKEKKDNEELRIDNSVKKNQIEMVSKLFVNKQNLDEVKEMDALINQMIVSAMDYFNAYYVTLYYKKDGAFVQIGEKGDRGKYNVPKTLSMHSAKEIYYDRQLMKLPILYEKNPWGIIAVYGKRSRICEDGQVFSFPFEESDYEILSIYVDSAMSRLKEIRRNEKLKKAALYDRLTNLPNRVYLEGELYNQKIDAAKREKKLFAVMLLDIDHFKSFNDTFGHDVGDEVLRMVSNQANTVLQKIDTSDVVGRWGGEEFLALVSGSPNECYQKAEMVRKSIESLQNRYRPITVSIGLAIFGVHGTNLDTLIKQADIALYQSKENGRNRVTVNRGGMGR